MQGVLDFACLALTTPLRKELVQRPLLETSLAVASRADHPMRGCTRLAELGPGSGGSCWARAGRQAPR